MKTQPVDAVLAALMDHGLLLAQDRSLPSVAGIVTGEDLRTSWWSHPNGRVVFAVLSHLAEHDDVLVTKLLHGKDTLVHRNLWPALLAVGRARESWQLRGLAAGARQLLSAIDSAHTAVRVTGVRSKPLVTRLLVVGRAVHTESGAHALALESWRAWSARTRCRPASSAAAGRRRLESAASELGASAAALPWTSVRDADGHVGDGATASKRKTPMNRPRPPKSAVTWNVVRALALALPGVADSRSYGTPSLKVQGRFMARLREDGETIALKMDFFEREELIHSDPEAFFVTDHYLKYPAVVVRLDKVRRNVLRRVLKEAWRQVSSAGGA